MAASQGLSRRHDYLLDLSTAVFTGGAGLIAGRDRIKFDPNIPGETATFTLASVPAALISDIWPDAHESFARRVGCLTYVARTPKYDIRQF